MPRAPILVVAVAALMLAGCATIEEATDGGAPAEGGDGLQLGECPRTFVTMHFVGSNFTVESLEPVYSGDSWAWKERAVGPAADVEPPARNSWVIEPPVRGVTGRAYLDPENGGRNLILHFEETLESESNEALVEGIAADARNRLVEAHPEARQIHEVEGQDYAGC